MKKIIINGFIYIVTTDEIMENDYRVIDGIAVSKTNKDIADFIKKLPSFSKDLEAPGLICTQLKVIATNDPKLIEDGVKEISSTR